MRRRVFLHGPLKELCDGAIEIVADTAAEVIEALGYQLKGLQPSATTGPRRLCVQGFPTLESMHQPLGDREEIHIAPAITFGKDSGLVQTIIGVTLIVVGIAMGGVFWPSIFITTGLSMVIGGIMQMLAPQPQLNSDQENRSRYLGAPGNTSKIGTRIAIGYGRDKVTFHVLAFDIDATDLGT